MRTPQIASDVRFPDRIAVTMLALTFAIGVAFYGFLPAEVVVGWHVGLDGSTRLTRAPRPLAAFAVPTVAVGVYALARVVATLPGVAEELDRRVYDAAVAVALAVLCASQAMIVAANL